MRFWRFWGGGPEAPEGVGTPPKEKRPRRKGDSRGRNGQKDSPGVEHVKVANPDLKSGDPCPECPKDQVYPLVDPKVLIRVKGMGPIQATIFELDRMRCNLCSQVFTAPAPEGGGGRGQVRRQRRRHGRPPEI